MHLVERAFDRWWLVECAHAEAGRILIETATDGPNYSDRVRELVSSDIRLSRKFGRIIGRILASGGAR